MGMAMAYVTATGLLLWTKRREDIALWRGFRHWTMMTIWGLPFAMLVSAVAYFLTLPAGAPMEWTPFAFFVAVAGVILFGLVNKNAQSNMRFATAALCIGLPLLRLLTGGASWSEARIAGAGEIIAIDVLFVALGLIMLRSYRKSDADQPIIAQQEPAE